MVPPAPQICEIAYGLTIWSATEQAKPKSQRKPESRILEPMRSDAEFLDVRDSFKLEFVGVLFPGQAIVPDSAFKVYYTITRHVPNEVPLETERDYAKMLNMALKMKTPAVKVVVYEQAPEKVSEFVSMHPTLLIFGCIVSASIGKCCASYSRDCSSRRCCSYYSCCAGCKEEEDKGESCSLLSSWFICNCHAGPSSV